MPTETSTLPSPRRPGRAPGRSPASFCARAATEKRGRGGGGWKELQFLSLKGSLPALSEADGEGVLPTPVTPGTLFPSLGHSDIKTHAVVSWAMASGGMLERAAKQMAVALGRRPRGR